MTHPLPRPSANRTPSSRRRTLPPLPAHHPTDLTQCGQVRPSPLRRLADLGRRVWIKPDPRSTEVGQGGEMLVARVRLALVAVLLAEAGGNALLEPADRAARALALDLGAALAVACLLALRARKPPPPRWLPLASSLADVSLATSGLAMVALVAPSSPAADGTLFFGLYLLALVGTALRGDPRLSLASGAAALAQYGLLVLATAWNCSATVVAGAGFSLAVALDRLILLALAAAATTALALRGRPTVQRSGRDSLTGVYDRSAFEALMRSWLEVARRRQEPLTVAFVDLDRFERWLEEHGPEAGGEALQRVAHALAASVRATDVLGRRNGREFAVLFPQTSLVAAGGILEKARRRIEESHAPGLVGTDEAEGDLRLTASVGAACWPQDGLAAEEILLAADRRLREAQAAGCNRVVTGFGHPSRPRPAGLGPERTVTFTPRRQPFARS